MGGFLLWYAALGIAFGCVGVCMALRRGWEVSLAELAICVALWPAWVFAALVVGFMRGDQ